MGYFMLLFVSCVIGRVLCAVCCLWLDGLCCPDSMCTLWCVRYQREMDKHRKSNSALMQQNLELIKEIKRQREDNKGERHTLQVGWCTHTRPSPQPHATPTESRPCFYQGPLEPLHSHTHIHTHHQSCPILVTRPGPLVLLAHHAPPRLRCCLSPCGHFSPCLSF